NVGFDVDDVAGRSRLRRPALVCLAGGSGLGFRAPFRGNIVVENAAGERRKASMWVRGSSARKLVDAKVTGDHAKVPAVVVIHANGMKEPWCLATSRTRPQPARS
ncbi:MAG: hypothetical protein NZX77_19930, partial [Polyangiaceae bacterium]|nr:hypothetical protein [Polyangiaceae bacterium]